MAFRVIFLLAVLACYFLKSSTAECQIDIGEDLQGKEPVLITKNGKLWVPSGSLISWKKAEKSLVACGGKNSVSSSSGSEAEIECSAKNEFKIDGSKKKFPDIQCSSSVTGDIETTEEKCASDGVIQRIGFNTKKFGLVKYIDVCYDMEKASVIYTHHIIFGKAIDNSAHGSIRPTFKITGIPSFAKPAQSYKQSAQLLRLTELLKSEAEAKKYISHESFLARGHLTPDADGIFKSWQHATFFYANVAPEWQTINAGNWVRVENLARKVASNLKDNLEVYTGIFDIMTLKSKTGEDVELSLEPNGIIPVPKWFWKIIKHKNAGIAFITLNNPFTTEIETLCTDVCEKYGYFHEAFNNYRHGYTYCCKISELTKVIPNIPKAAHAKSVLKF